MKVLYMDLSANGAAGRARRCLPPRTSRAWTQRRIVDSTRFPTRKACLGVADFRASSSPIWMRLWAASAIRRLIAGERFDIVHVNEPHALTAAWLAGVQKSVPWWSHVE